MLTFFRNPVGHRIPAGFPRDGRQFQHLTCDLDRMGKNEATDGSVFTYKLMVLIQGTQGGTSLMELKWDGSIFEGVGRKVKVLSNVTVQSFPVHQYLDFDGRYTITACCLFALEKK